VTTGWRRPRGTREHHPHGRGCGKVSAARQLAGLLLISVALTACVPVLGPDDAVDPAVRAELDHLFDEPHFLSRGDFQVIASSRDRRVAWPLVDLLRFHQGGDRAEDLAAALGRVTAHHLGDDWVGYTDLLLRDDVPAPPGYLQWKRAIFLAVDDSWEPFFDAEADLDWREVTWGGVFRDGIVSLDDPLVVTAAEVTWLPEDEVIFGVVLDGQTRAYPRRVLEVHEIVNDELAGRRITLPYCTLCGAAIAYDAEGVPGTDGPVRFDTSGLLQRSNKLMYDRGTESLFDQFAGRAVSGPLRGEGLNMLSLTVTTWGAWKAEHPTTTILAEDPGTGRAYQADPLAGRDDDGPIFPVGGRDGRLPAQEEVLGVISPRGQTVAFPVEQAKAALAAGAEVAMGGVALMLDASGLTAGVDGSRRRLPSHQAFWFAWSQFHPGTLLWEAHSS
jgi:hypothetical protein